MAAFSEEFFSENNFWGCFSYFLLLWLWCKCFWGNRELLQTKKIIANAPCICYDLLDSQNISIRAEKVGDFDISGVAKKTTEVAQKKEH